MASKEQLIQELAKVREAFEAALTAVSTKQKVETTRRVVSTVGV